jgi:hypothetical protein
VGHGVRRADDAHQHDSTKADLNPLELNGIYEHLFVMGTLLQSESSLDVFAEGYRPWPALEVARKWYTDNRPTDKPDDLGVKRREQLRDCTNHGAEYVAILKEILSLFGAGIHESLKRTIMGDFLEVTKGCKAQSELEPWMKARCPPPPCAQQPRRAPIRSHEVFRPSLPNHDPQQPQQPRARWLQQHLQTTARPRSKDKEDRRENEGGCSGGRRHRRPKAASCDFESEQREEEVVWGESHS